MRGCPALLHLATTQTGVLHQSPSNAIGDAKIDCFEHFWQPSGQEAAPLCYPPTAPSGQMQRHCCIPGDASKQPDCRYETPPHSPASSSAICLCRLLLPL
jgi:hypothetical protein